MADSPPPPSLSDWPAPQVPLPLADLSPTTTTTTNNSSTYITAVITLIWPFSSSNRTLSIIASEPNPLLRLTKGQLRINFHGPAATAVDKHGLQSGDHICVSLSSARWDELPSVGPRDVPWAVSFERRLAMKIKAGDEWSSIDIDVDMDTDLAPEQSPAAVKEPSAPPPAHLNGGEWVAPSLFKRRLTSSPDSGPSNVFSIGEKGLFDGADDEYDLGHRRKRARFSSSSFRFEEDTATVTTATMGESDSSTLEEALMNGLASSAEETEVEAATTTTIMGEEDMAIERPPIAVGNPNHVDMPPPPPPPPQLALNTNFDVGDTPDSPDLKPVPSEQLSIISPFLGKGLAGLDYMDYSVRARDAEAAGEVAGAEEISQGSTGSSTLQNESLDGFRSTPEVVIVPVNDEERDGSTTSRPGSPTKLSAKPLTTAATPGPSDAQKRADQRRGSFSEEDRFPSDYESEKDSLFDEFSDNELRRRRTTKSRTLGRSPLKSVESLKPRPRTTPLRSKLTLETTVVTPETPIKEDGGEHPKTPFLYLPTPSPKTEKRGIQFPPTSAPPKFMSREYESVLGGDITSPIRRRSSFWGMREEPVPDEIDAFFGGGKGFEAEKEAESVSGTEEGFSGFSTPMEGDEEEDENDEQDEDEEDEDEDEESFGLELGFRSGITTNLSDFPALRSLTWGAVVDLIAVVTRSWPPARAKRGQKDYYMSMRVVDSSFPAGMTATVLRPHQEALPVVRVGDVVLLRSFKITTHKHDFVATSTPNSAWAVWREHGKGRPVITGPPVEYGEGEEAYVAAIAEWFERLEPEVREGMVKGSFGGDDDELDFDL